MDDLHLIPLLFEYLELLPVRPPRQVLESLNSMLMKVKTANGFASQKDLYTHIQHQAADVDRAYTDTVKWQRLAKLLRLSLEELREMTSYYLEEKFRHNQDSPAEALFKRCWSSHLRFCPKCLAEHNSYLLTWAFNIIPGCVKHACYFLEKWSYPAILDTKLVSS